LATPAGQARSAAITGGLVVVEATVLVVAAGVALGWRSC
jgi:hypothetical protein